MNGSVAQNKIRYWRNRHPDLLR